MEFTVTMTVDAADQQAAVKKLKKDATGLRPADIKAVPPESLCVLKKELDEIYAEFDDVRDRVQELCSEWESVPSVMAFLEPIYGDLGETYPNFDLVVTAEMIQAAVALEEKEAAA